MCVCGIKVKILYRNKGANRNGEKGECWVNIINEQQILVKNIIYHRIIYNEKFKNMKDSNK